MEPKSIAFYTAVAIGILAVLSATIVPTLVQTVQAQQANQEDGQEEASAGDEAATAAEEEAATAAEEATTTAEEAVAGDEGPDEETTLEASDGMVSCGEVITEDMTLQQDLNCPEDGVIIRGSDIEFNMNGHTISSTDEDDSVDLSMDYNGYSGILVSNVDGVTITGLGEVNGFERGIAFTGSSGAQVSDVSLTENGVGVLVSGSSDTVINSNTIDSNRFGVVSESSDDGVISFNQITTNEQAGIVILDSDVTMIAGNGVFANGETGIFLDAQSNENLIDYNNVFAHGESDLNNANGTPTNVNDNNFGENNNCGTSTPAGLC
jgi:parallel beta-helix repeat protein